MRIIIYGINYAPELTGIGKYTGEMASWLAKQGHDVTMVTALPYYPEWKVHPSYRGKLWKKEKVEGVTVYRCPLYVPEKVTSLKRIIHEFSFLLGIFPIVFLTLFQKKYDIVLCISPPFHLGILPLIYSKIRGAKFISHIQDLQVDAAKDLGMIKNKHFLNLMFGTEKVLLHGGSVVSTISLGMQKKIEKKGIPKTKMMLFPNWVDEGAIRPLTKEMSLRKKFGIDYADQVILYSGNLGEKQGLEMIIEVARYFQDRKNIHFVISGTGGGKDRLIAMAKEFGLSNVKFYPLQPYDKLSSLLATADIHLVLQKKSASDLVMPSKLTSILAAGGCAIVTALPGSTLYDIIQTHQMGILVEPESVIALKEGIEKALAMDINILRSNARKYAETHLGKTDILTRFEEKVLQMLCI